jgi:hypothetical protein
LLRFRPNTLDGVHRVLLLREKGFAELLHPLELTVHPLEDLRRANQSFDAIVPFVVFERFVQGIALQAWIGFCESRRLDNLKRIRGCLEDLRHERVRIQRNGRDNVLEFLGLEGTRVGTAWLLRPRGEWCKRKAQN